MAYIGKSPSGTGVRQRYYFTATGGETSLSGTDDNGLTLSYSDGAYVDVLLNGIELVAGTDYNTSTANTIAGLAALAASDVVTVTVYDIFTVADTVSAKNGGTFSGNVVMNADLTVDGGTIKLDGNYPVGTDNVALGDTALDSTASDGIGNTAIGSGALTANSTGDNNVAVGYGAAGANTTGSVNVAIGALAFNSNTTGAYNTAVGKEALYSNTTANANDAYGFQSMYSNTTGYYNSSYGYRSMYSNTTGYANAALGFEAMYSHTTGSANTSMGYRAGKFITSGTANTLIGIGAGANGTNTETGTANTLIGAYMVADSTSSLYAIGLGYGMTCAGGYTTLGRGAADIRAAHGSTTWSTVSDERYKKDIADSTAGLSFINDLTPRTFKYRNLGELPETFNAYEEGSTEVFKNSQTNHGFIAQEVKAVIDAHPEIKDGFRMWDDRSDGSQEVAEAALIPVLVKAIQELSAKNDALEARVTALETA